MITAQATPTTSVIPHIDWESLVHALRAELQEYGALLNLLSDHQECIIKRDSERILELNEHIDQQISASANLRAQRESLVADLASQAGLKKNTSIKSLYHLFPETIQHLVEALSEEVISIIKKTQHRARQNQVLIKRATEITEELLDTIQAKSTTRTYDCRGSVKKHTVSKFSCIKATA